jgi:hypothetical protein
MPDNDLERRLAVIESEFGLTRPNQTDVRASHTDNINWKALYKVLESEVETVILDPNCPQYVKDWGSKIMSRLAEHLPRR